MTTAEARAAARNTRAFIRADPVVVVLSRRPIVGTTAGGRKLGPPSSVPPQTMRLVPLSGNVWDRSKQKVDEGNLPDVTHQLIGMPDADVHKDDEFVVGSDRWKVTHVSPERRDRTSANVMILSQDG